MFRFFRPEGEIRPLAYAALAPTLVLSQHLLVWSAFMATHQALIADELFWLLPLRSLSLAQGLPMWAAGLAFATSLLTAWILAILSVRRASWSRSGYALAGLAIIPGLQIPTVALLIFMARGPTNPTDFEGRFAVSRFMQVFPAVAALIAAIAAHAIWSVGSYLVIAFAITASVQFVSVLWATIPSVFEPVITTPYEWGRNLSHVIKGVFAGVAIIVGATFLSAVTLGAYGWGLFVMTPFTVGVATGYMANRQTPLPEGKTTPLVLTAAALGSLALIAFALEGLICIVLATPVGAVMAWAGGHFGRTIALERRGGGTPAMSVALLPALFMLEASEPPVVPIAVVETIDIAAPPTAVWQAVTSEDAIAIPPSLIFRAGLAYPINGRLIGRGVGARRIGTFSTGVADERVTSWAPDHRLSFTVLSQPPAMEEMSPYRKVHAPHVSGYFETRETSFTLTPLPAGGTRLTVSASHILRIDPALYWQPIARWAIHENVTRVLTDIQAKAEARVGQ